MNKDQECEIENQFQYDKQPNKKIIKKAEKKLADNKKPIDPKYIFNKTFKKKKGIAYRKPSSDNNEKLNNLDDMMYN